MVTSPRRHPSRLGGPWLLGLVARLLLWGSPGAWASYLRRSSSCMPIPHRMALCYDIGYSEMRIPNLLEHETMTEVIQQSSSWLPLLARECHPDARIFLCSLFAPICLDRLIYPCRSLCEAVKRSCAPVMACYGYPWPEILNCNKFPADHELCIAAVSMDENSSSRRTVPRASCKDCELEEASTAREILESLCANDFAVKIRILRRNTTTTISDFDLDPSKVEVLKHGPLLRTEIPARLQQWLDIDATCAHNIMRGTQAGVFVVSGEVQSDKVVVNKAYAWQKRNRNLHQAVRRWKHHRCPEQIQDMLCSALRRIQHDNEMVQLPALRVDEHPDSKRKQPFSSRTGTEKIAEGFYITGKKLLFNQKFSVDQKILKLLPNPLNLLSGGPCNGSIF
ncbi:secreted frizzled-related protein 5-like [Lonchura striata]